MNVYIAVKNHILGIINVKNAGLFIAIDVVIDGNAFAQNVEVKNGSLRKQRLSGFCNAAKCSACLSFPR